MPSSLNRLPQYPNPFENEFSIRGIKAKGVAIICDVTGKELVKQNIVDVDDAINTIFLTPGIYLLNYTCGNATANTKIVKFH